MTVKISFQGELGAYSHLACQKFFPDSEPVPCESFERAFALVSDGAVERAMIPVENTLAGRVADIHYLLPDSNLEIEAEKFLPIHHQLLGVKGASLETVKQAFSHPMALGQCRVSLRDFGIKASHTYDTAGAAQQLAASGSLEEAAIASALAGKIYGLEVLAADIEDAKHNTTRFLIMHQKQEMPEYQPGTTYMTSFVFEVRNITGALYKALGGFATNGVNMTKLESYQLGGSFTATQFFSDIVGHPDQPTVAQALEELGFFCSRIKMVGTYEADSFRL
ncbi:MAG: prephenate dehydratase [Robiginitomaculum sp.]|nr:MAG: prephenate dehydratase [Robiginitomaculum sp.]